jgi:hypothetical protein
MSQPGPQELAAEAALSAAGHPPLVCMPVLGAIV